MVVTVVENFFNLALFFIDRNDEANRFTIFDDFNFAPIEVNHLGLIHIVEKHTIPSSTLLFCQIFASSKPQYNVVKLAEVDLERVVFLCYLDWLLLQIDLRCSLHD